MLKRLLSQLQKSRTPRAWVVYICFATGARRLYNPPQALGPALAYGFTVSQWSQLAWNEFLCCCDDSCSCFSSQ